MPEEIIGQPKQQDSPPENGPRGYTRMAVMDGKTITHKVVSRFSDYFPADTLS